MEEQRKHIYFASDFHLGVPSHHASLKREKLLVEWLDQVSGNAAEIYLMGDLFDFWFEYKTVVPKGFVRLMGKIAEITDQGIPVNVFRGNHDIWAFDYLHQELGVSLFRNPVVKTFHDKVFFLAHGDGLGPGDNGYKFLKRIFENKVNQFLFKWVHPDIGTKLGLFFSRRSRISNIAREEKNNLNINMDTEMITAYSRKKLKEHPGIHYFIFGHRHFPVDYPLTESSRLVLLGDWVTNFTYAVFDGEELQLKKFR